MFDLNLNASNVSQGLFVYPVETSMNASNVSQESFAVPLGTPMNASNVPNQENYIEYYYDYDYYDISFYKEFFGNTSYTPVETEMDRILTYIHYFTYVFLSLQVAIGVTGNAISFLVWMSGKECSTIACSAYFKLLALSDIFALTYCGLCYVIFKSLELVQLPYLVWCIGLEFFSLFAPQMSTWLIALISVERVLSLTFPFSFNTKGARFRAKVAFLSLIIVLTATNSQAFIKQFLHGTCITKLKYGDVVKKMVGVSSVWMLCVIPFLIIIICNTIIVVRFCLMKKTAAMGRQRSQRLVTFTRLSLASGILQAVSMCPTMVKYLFFSYESLTYSKDMENIMYYFSLNTLYLNNALQFMVCWLGSTHYRSDLKTFLFGKQNNDVRNQRTSQVTSE